MSEEPETGDRPPVLAPFTPQQVATLNAFQEMGAVHPFTCGNRPLHPQNEGILIADTDGWHCPVEDCTYSQTWAHWFMADTESVERMRAFQQRWASFAQEREDVADLDRDVAVALDLDAGLRKIFTEDANDS